MLREERAWSRVPRAGGGSSGVAHQARGAGKRLAHAHALPVDAQGVRLDGQLVLQPALGRQQQLQCVLRLPQPQLEGLQSVIDGEHLVQEPEARAEGKHSSARCSTHTHTHLLRARHCARRRETAVSHTGKAQPSSKDKQTRERTTELRRVTSMEGEADGMFWKAIRLLL